VVTGLEPTTSGLLDQRRSRSDNQVPCEEDLGQGLAASDLYDQQRMNMNWGTRN